MVSIKPQNHKSSNDTDKYLSQSFYKLQEAFLVTEHAEKHLPQSGALFQRAKTEAEAITSTRSLGVPDLQPRWAETANTALQENGTPSATPM